MSNNSAAHAMPGSDWDEYITTQLGAAGFSGCSAFLAGGLHATQDQYAHGIPGNDMKAHFYHLEF